MIKDRAKTALKAAKSALNGLEGSIGQVKQSARIIRRSKGDVIVTGIGKSGFIGQKLVATLTSLGKRAFYLHPTDALHGDLGMLSKDDMLVALSFSGESKEVVSIARYAKKNFGVPVIVICRSSNSSLGKVADCLIEVPVKEEGSPNGIAPMASTTAMLVLSDMLASEMMSPNFRDEHFAAYHPGGSLGLSLKKVKDFMKKGNDVPKVKESNKFLDAVKEINNKRLGVTAVIGVKGDVKGVITDGDIRRFILKNKNIFSAKTKDAMTTTPKYVEENTSLKDALDIMENSKITNIFTVNKNKKLTGIIHIHDILGEML